MIMEKQKIRAKRYKKAHNILNNNVEKSKKGFYKASREFGLSRK